MASGASASTADPQLGDHAEHVSSPIAHDVIVRSLDAGAFELWFQPIVCLRTLEVRSFEGLARLRLDNGEIAMPGRFIAAIEQDPVLYERFTDQMIDRAIAFVARATATGVDLHVTVNLAEASLRDDGLVERVDAMLGRHGAQPSQLVFEVTEREFIEPTPVQRASLQRMSELGVGLAIDDFGTGWSSLETLRWLPLSQLKVDRCFLDQITQHNTDRIIVEKVIDLAHSLHLLTIAEGIESNQQLEILRTIGCDRGQGFLFSPAVEPDAAMDLARRGISALAAPSLDMAVPIAAHETVTSSSFRLDVGADCVSEVVDDPSTIGSLGLQALEMLPMPVFVKALDGRLVWCNESHWRRLGAKRRSDVIGLRDLDLHRVDEALRYRRVDLAVLTTGEPMVDHREFQTRSGGRRSTLRTSKFPVVNRNGMIIGLIGFYIEVGTDGAQWLDDDLARLSSAAQAGALLLGGGDAGGA